MRHFKKFEQQPNVRHLFERYRIGLPFLMLSPPLFYRAFHYLGKPRSKHTGADNALAMHCS